MKTRPTTLILALAAMLAAPAFAQAPTVAGLADAAGQVMISQNDGLVPAGANQRVATGTRVVTLAGAKVTVVYDNGCRVSLAENRQFTVRTGECAALVADVVALAPAAGAIGGGAAAVAGPLAGAGFLAGATAVTGGLYAIFHDKNVSPD